MFNPFNEAVIRQHLRTDERVDFIIKSTTASTNDDAKALAAEGKDEIIAVLAESQTCGRGRKGRSFFSPENTGCYMSFLFRPRCAGEVCTLLTPLAAAAAAVAIERLTGKKADIKWINDIYVEGKKVAGILTEGAFTANTAEYAVVGIGINLAEPKQGFPTEIAEIAGAIGAEDADIKSKLVGEILTYFIYHYRKLEEKLFFADYKERLLYLGEEITVIRGESTFSAKALDIDPNFRLIVEKQGEKLTLESGEVTTRKLGIRNY